MNKSTSIALRTAAVWAVVLSTVVVVGPLLSAFATGAELNGGLFAHKLMAGVALLPITFIAVFVWQLIAQRRKARPTAPTSATTNGVEARKERPRKISNWNYAGITMGIFLLAAVFAPAILGGGAGKEMYLGAAFWLAVITYTAKNILDFKRTKPEA